MNLQVVSRINHPHKDFQRKPKFNIERRTVRLPSSKHIIARVNGGLEIFQTSHIQHVESYGNYVRIYLDDRESIDLWVSLGKFLEKMPTKLVVRTHQSHAVAIDRIVKVKANTVELDNGTAVPLSRRNRAHVDARILNHHEAAIVL